MRTVRGRGIRARSRAATRGAGPVSALCRALAGLLLLVAAGCAPNADWIEGTLVTVDVSGSWRGSVPYQGELELNLVQDGAKVTGQGQLLTTKFRIEGTVRGDVLAFQDPGGRLRGEAVVTGDAMTA